MTAHTPMATDVPPFTQQQLRIGLRYSGDIRLLLMASRTFILQLAHPAVGAGVMEHSTFRQDPWHRLKEIAYSGNQITFGDPESAQREGQRLRELHRDIKGTDRHGNRYHALNPKTYGWVHFVFLESMLSTHALLAKPVPPDHQELLFRQWRDSGHYFGLRDQDLPRNLRDYWEYFDEMMRTTLEYNDAIHYILSLDEQTPAPPPPLANWPHWLWQGLWKPVGRFGTLLTIGSLPAGYRKKFAREIPWRDSDAVRFERDTRRIRNLLNPLPLRLKLMPQAYRRLLEI